MNGDGTEPLAQQRPEIQAIASKTRAFGSPGGEDHRMTRQAAPNTYPAAEILHRLVPGASFIATMMRRGPTKSLPRPGGTATRNCGMWQRSFLHLPTRLFRTLGCHREERCGSHSFHAQRCSFKCLSQGSEDAHARPGGGGKRGSLGNSLRFYRFARARDRKARSRHPERVDSNGFREMMLQKLHPMSREPPAQEVVSTAVRRGASEFRSVGLFVRRRKFASGNGLASS